MGKLSDLASKAKQALEKNKEVKKSSVRSKTLDMDLTFRALNAEEWDRIFTAPLSEAKQAKKAIYTACPELHKAALELVQEGAIAEYEDVVDIFSEMDKKRLFSHLIKLSGLTGESQIVLPGSIDAIKN